MKHPIFPIIIMVTISVWGPRFCVRIPQITTYTVGYQALSVLLVTLPMTITVALSFNKSMRLFATFPRTIAEKMLVYCEARNTMRREETGMRQTGGVEAGRNNTKDADDAEVRTRSWSVSACLRTL